MQSAKELIKQRLPITDVLASYITLEQSGNQYKAKCPFHNERTASFSISPERGVYYCFGCGVKGDIFTFVEQFEGVDFRGALRILADRAGVSLDSGSIKKETTDPVYDILDKATTLYEQELKHNPDALEYLAARGIQLETIATFRIGYVPNTWRFITHVCTPSELPYAVRAGLIKKNDQSYYDRFRGRIMFPLCDSSGRIVGFSGRLFPEETTPSSNTTDSHASPSPKYLNSPETEVFQKSHILYGFDKAKFAIKKNNFAIMVEGQIDLILSHQAGFKNTVATSGTAVSDTAAEDMSTNLAVVSRLTPNLFLAFDGDSAGQKALSRAALVALALSMNPKVVSLPHGMDPADYLHTHGAEAWKVLLKESVHFIVHELARIQEKKQEKNGEKAPHALVREIRERLFPVLMRIPSPLEQTMYLGTIAREIGVNVSEVQKEFVLYVKEQSHPSMLTQEKKAVQKQIVTQTIAIVDRLWALKHRYSTPAIEACVDTVQALSFEDEKFIFQEPSEDRTPALIALAEREYGSLNERDREILAQELAEKITREFFAAVRHTYSRLLKEAEQKNDEASVMRILSQLHVLTKRRQGD